MKKAATPAILVAVTLLAVAVIAEAQQPEKNRRIGFLDDGTASGSAVLVEAFRQELGKLGWIEGKRITIEYRFADQKNERLPELAADLVRHKVDVIVVAGTGPALAAKGATTTIPIVVTSSSDPVGTGLVASLARPGGNVTGAIRFTNAIKHEKAGGTQGRGPQTRPSWSSAATGRQHSNIKRSPIERA